MDFKNSKKKRKRERTRLRKEKYSQIEISTILYPMEKESIEKESINTQKIKERINKYKKNKESMNPKLIQLLPNEILFRIFQYSDIDTQFNFSSINKLFNEEYGYFRDDIMTHYQIINDEMDQLTNELDHEMVTNPLINRYEIKKWTVYTQVECPYHEYHYLEMNYIRNPRDVDIQSWLIDDQYSYTIL